MIRLMQVGEHGQHHGWGCVLWLRGCDACGTKVKNAKLETETMRMELVGAMRCPLSSDLLRDRPLKQYWVEL